jgi:predicted phosphodiesterase
MKKLVSVIIFFVLLTSVAVGQHKKTIKIGICSDVHLPTMHDGKERLTTFLDSMKIAKPDFIIQLGDFVTPAPAWTESYDPWKTYQGKKYNVIGNHEMDGGYSLEKALEFRNMNSSYYTFSSNGFQFIVLDGNDKKSPDQKGYREYMGPTQVQWLKETLKNSKEPIVIFSHQGLGSYNGIENQKEVRAILEEHNVSTHKAKVIACFNGHTHGDIAEDIQGIWYITINSMSYQWLGEEYPHVRYSEEVDKNFKWIKYTAPYKDPLFAVVEISTGGYIKITGRKSEYVGPSPWEIGFPEEKKPYFRPEITSRNLPFTLKKKR